MMSDKIRQHHLDRRAILYVRQSSSHQVLNNRESRALQYAMRERLVALGWSEIEIIDDDQSGQFRGQTRLSKFGNTRLRRTFWLAAQVAIHQRDNSFRDHFGRHIAKDRDNKDLRRKALTAVAAKMARVAHALVKTGTDYRPFLEGPVPSGRTRSVGAVRAGPEASTL
jgi:hypothetical protein